MSARTVPSVGGTTVALAFAVALAAEVFACESNSEDTSNPTLTTTPAAEWEEAVGVLGEYAFGLCGGMDQLFILDPCLYGFGVVGEMSEPLSPYLGQWLRVRGPIWEGVDSCRVLLAMEIAVVPPCVVYDANGDDRIDFMDIAPLSTAYGSTSGGTSYNARYDANKDGKVSFQDISPFSTCYGSSW